MTIFVNHDRTRVWVCDACGAQTMEHPKHSLHGRRPNNVWTDNSGPFFARGTDEDGRSWFEGGFTDFCPRCSG